MSKTINSEKTDNETVEALDSDTQRNIRTIKQLGYYEPHQTMGVGGWPIVYKFTRDWKQYLMVGDGDINDRITAKDDEAAERAFSDKYNLGQLTWYAISEVMTTYRNIA